MKKLMALSVIVLMLAGCSESMVKKETENLIESDYKEVWNENINDDVKGEIKDLQKEFSSIVIEPLNLEGEDVELSSIKGYNEVMNKLDKLKKQTEYEFTDVEIDKEKAKVYMKAKYADVGSTLTKAISESMDKASLKIYSGEKMTKAEYLESVFENLNKELDGAKFKKYLSDKVEVVLEKKDDWKASKLNQEALDTLTLNFTKQKEALKKKTEETKQNIFFMQTESNLRNVFSEVEKVVSDGKATYEKLKTKDVADNVKKATGLNSAVTDKIGDKEDFYYIIKNGGNNLSVIVIRNGEQFKFSEKLK